MAIQFKDLDGILSQMTRQLALLEDNLDARRTPSAQTGSGNTGIVPPDRLHNGNTGIVPPDRFHDGNTGIVPPPVFEDGFEGRQSNSWLRNNPLNSVTRDLLTRAGLNADDVASALRAALGNDAFETRRPPITGPKPPVNRPPVTGPLPPETRPPLTGPKPPVNRPPVTGPLPPETRPPLTGPKPPVNRPPVTGPLPPEPRLTARYVDPTDTKVTPSDLPLGVG